MRACSLVASRNTVSVHFVRGDLDVERSREAVGRVCGMSGVLRRSLARTGTGATSMPAT